MIKNDYLKVSKCLRISHLKSMVVACFYSGYPVLSAGYLAKSSEEKLGAFSIVGK